MFIKILPFLSILIFRFLGLFIVLPVISLLIAGMPHANAWTIGLAIGIPYLFQILCQPFFGRWSDKYGRKPILLLGLIIFLIGTIICMFEDSIYFLILGRCIQGMGAIGGILSALVADSVREEKRTSAMALMGIGVFLSFVLAMVLGPILGAHYGLNSLFALSALVTLISILIAVFFIQQPPKTTYSYPEQTSNEELEKTLKRNILILNFSGFFEKLLMILIFSLTPIILNEYLPREHFYFVYVPAICAGILALGPASVLAEKKAKAKAVLLVSIFLMLTAYFCMAIWLQNIIIFTLALAFFFAGFCIQEALLQSMISKYARTKDRGAVLGDFNAASFFGSFVGAMLGGLFANYERILEWQLNLFGILMACVVLWFLLIFTVLKQTNANKTLYIPMQDIKGNKEDLNTLAGIMEWYENTQEKVLSIRYNTQIQQADMIYEILKAHNTSQSNTEKHYENS